MVDDEPRIVSFVSRALAAEGISVDTANEGARAIHLATTHHYDLVILDLLLPTISGMAVLRGIIDDSPDQRVLVLSALSDVSSKVQALELGAVDYLSKPFALAELVARVRARLRQPAAPPMSRQLTVGELTLDFLRRVAHTPEASVGLSEREFLLLQYLMQRAGEVCGRDELLADVWGYSHDPGSNVVDVYVRRLRAKLGAELIETVRNVGYRLDTP